MRPSTLLPRISLHLPRTFDCRAPWPASSATCPSGSIWGCSKRWHRQGSLLLVGPRQATFEIAKLDRLLASPNVQWVGAKNFQELPSYLRVIDVGLTPYSQSDFNRASFPAEDARVPRRRSSRRGQRPAGPLLAEHPTREHRPDTTRVRRADALPAAHASDPSRT